jgi:putative tryptophan/tyrosine transport system substrate-binding protein
VARQAVPAIYSDVFFIEPGSLMSYGIDAADADAPGQCLHYCSRILCGEKPADLPVQQSRKVELVIKLKTAKALGGRADRVIE